MFIDLLEFLFFQGHFLLNIFGREDRFKVHPSPLGLDPVLEGILNENQFGLNVISTGDDGLNVRGAFHH